MEKKPGTFTGKDDPRNGGGGERVNAGRKPKLVKEFREELTKDFVNTYRRFQELRDSTDEAIAIQACTWLGNQAIGRPKETVEVSVEGKVSVLMAVIDAAEVAEAQRLAMESARAKPKRITNGDGGDPEH